MSKKIILSLVAVAALQAELLEFSSTGYNNAQANGYAISENFALAVKDCFNPNNATNGAIHDKYTPAEGNYKHNYGNKIEICNYLKQTQIKKAKYVVQCDRLGKNFANITNADGYGNEYRDYLASTKDFNFENIAFNQNKSLKYNLNRQITAKTFYTPDRTQEHLAIIQDAYTLFKTKTTGRLALNNNGNGVGYMLDHTPVLGATSDLNKFINAVVGSQTRKYVSDVQEYKNAFNNVYGRIFSYKIMEKALLKNLRAIDYIGYFDYERPLFNEYPNEGRCYNFDIEKYDRVNTPGNPRAVIRARNFLFEGGNDYIFKNGSKNYSIHKSKGGRAGIYGNDGDEVSFGLNVRANSQNANGTLSYIFYPDAKTLEQVNNTISLKDINGTALSAREKDNKYYLSGDTNKKCELGVVGGDELVLKLNNCDINQENIEIIEQIGDYERVIFQESGADIIKGSKDKVEQQSAKTSLRTAFVDNGQVITDDRINSATQYGDAIYTTLANGEFYVQLQTPSQSDFYVDFNVDGNYEIISAHDEFGTVRTVNNECAGKYPAKTMVLKLKTNNPKQINSLSYTKYKIEKENGKEVCKALNNYKSNEFAIRPAEFQTGNSALTQEAGVLKNVAFKSSELAGFKDLAIGFAKLDLSYAGVDKSFDLLNGKDKISQSNAAAVNAKGEFSLGVNFALASDAKIRLAEINFAKNDRELGLCDAARFDNTNTQKNGKISCNIVLSKPLDIDFTSITSANNADYEKCDSVAACEAALDAKVGKIGIRNTAYDKLMLGDKNALVYTLNLSSKNSKDRFIPTKFKNGLKMNVKVEGLKKVQVDGDESRDFDISADDLNEAFKKAYLALDENANIADTKIYQQDEANYVKSTGFTFIKKEVVPLQKIALDVKVADSDAYGINYHNNYDLAYTGLYFNDLDVKGKKIALEYPKNCDFGYYDEKAKFVKDNRLMLKDVLSHVSFASQYASTKISGAQFESQTDAKYLKDIVRFKAHNDYLYLANPKDTFTIEYR